MINFNTVNKANTAQSLLPSFAETADISGESFQSLFDSVKGNYYDKSLSPYSRKENSYSSYQENNSYSSYSDTKKYSNKVSENKYSKEDDDYNRDDDKRYSKDEENYEAVERKVYREDSPSSRNIKDTNTVKEQNVFEKKDIKDIQNSQAGTEGISNQEIQSNQNAQLESNRSDTVSIKDILALLQTAAKNNTASEAANDENAVLENTNIDADTLLQNIDAAISELNISDDLKIQLQNIISSFENMDQFDLQDISEYIAVLSDDLNISDISGENISLEKIAEKIIGTEIDSSSLENAYTALQEKVSELTNNTKDNTAVETENTQSIETVTSVIDDKPNNIEVINDIASLIDEAVKESGFTSDNEKLELAKNIISAVKSAAENVLSQSNNLSGQVSANIITAEKAVIVNTETADNTAMQTAQTLEENINIIDENINNKQSAEKLSQDTVKETVKDTVKESVKDTVKDTVKQSDAVSVKDVQKEFKTANVEVTESLRAESAAKADIKAATVTFNEAGKNLQNNLSRKDMITQNSAGENFSASQSDKGNNFNYFLKSSAESQAKYETAQSKEAQAPYNMKEPRDIERLVRTMQSSVNKGESKLTVVLTPENLGKMQIQLSESGGKITAKFLSDNENSHKLIMAQSDLIKNQLSEKGIVIDNMEFAFNDAMSRQQTGEEQGRRASKQSQRNKGFKNQEEDLEVGTQVANNKSTGIYA